MAMFNSCCKQKKPESNRVFQSKSIKTSAPKATFYLKIGAPVATPRCHVATWHQVPWRFSLPRPWPKLGPWPLRSALPWPWNWGFQLGGFNDGHPRDDLYCIYRYTMLYPMIFWVWLLWHYGLYRYIPYDFPYDFIGLLWLEMVFCWDYHGIMMG